MSKPDDYELCTDIESQRQAVLELAQLAARNLQIFSEDLQPAIYNQQSFIDTCKTLVLRHPSCSIRVLVKNTESLRSMEHRLLDLIQRLPSRVELKVCHQEDKETPESWMSADEHGLFLKPLPGRTSARLYKNNYRLSHDYQRRFSNAWDRAEPATVLRRLSL